MSADTPALFAAPLRELIIRIPGEPVAQGRPRAFYRPGLGVRVYDPQKSRNWKATAQQHGGADPGAAGGPRAPVSSPRARWSCASWPCSRCPRSHWRKRDPVPRRPKLSKPDAENVAKGGAGRGLGRAVHRRRPRCAGSPVEKFVGAQGEAPYVEVTVRELGA